MLDDPKFLFRANEEIGQRGVVGEVANRLVLFLAGLTKDFSKPVSALLKGLRSTGKNNVAKAVTDLFPPECVVRRSSLTKKALAYGAEDLKGKIFYLYQYDGGKEAQLLLRILQSEGALEHEYTQVMGQKRGTEIARRIGTPVILTTTTADSVYEDDETRFVSVRSDDSQELTREVIRQLLGSVGSKPGIVRQDISVWQEAIRIVGRNVPKFVYPAWFKFLAEHFPTDDSRARRDVPRFLTLLQVVANCLSYSDERRKKSGAEIEITFGDYCVGWRILNAAFSATYRGVAPETLKISEAVRDLHSTLGRPVSVDEVAKYLNWNRALVYKWRKKALSRKLVQEAPGNLPQNKKPLVPGSLPSGGFLPAPESVFRECPEIGDEVHYVNPITGEERVMLRLGKKIVDREFQKKTAIEKTHS